MAVCTLMTTLSSLMVTDMKKPCAGGLVTATLDECLHRCFYRKRCQSYFYKESMQQCCIVEGQRLLEADLLPEAGINYYWLYPEYCSPSTGYILSRPANLCIKIFTQSVDWLTAKANCETDGARLVKLDSPSKFNRLKLLFSQRPALSSRSFAIGGKYNTVTSQWEWLDGSVIDVNDWHQAPVGGASRVVQMATALNHEWRDILDTETGGYVCELPFVSLDPYVGIN